MCRRYIATIVFGALLAFAIAPSTFAAQIYPRTMSVGMHGSDVQALQIFLRQQGYFTYPTITGYFGPVTRTAVIAFQKANTIDPVGWAGPKTRATIITLSKSAQLTRENAESTSTATSTIDSGQTSSKPAQLIPFPAWSPGPGWTPGFGASSPTVSVSDTSNSSTADTAA